MIQESLLKTNFLGRDGFRWWIGQIPQESAHGGQINGAGWGNRFKVRIMGYHPYDLTELPDEDLPWAQCLLPTTAGTGAGNNATSVNISPGDVVFGFFLDTDNAQTPVIMGCFGRTSQVLTSDSPGPFRPFTGYTTKVVKPNGITDVKPDQTNEQNANSQKSPRHVSPEQAKKLGGGEISYFSGIGDKIQLADTVNSTTVNKISVEVNNLVNKLNAPAIFTNIKNEVNRVADKIQAITNGLVGNMVNKLFSKLAPMLNRGLKLLYQLVYNLVFAATQNPAIAHAAGVAAQTAMVPPVNVLQEAIPCVSSAVVNSLGSVIKKILNSVVDNVRNFVSCAADQFTGALVNDIIGKISNGLSSAISGVQKILQFFSSFSVDGFLRESSNALKGLVGLFDCNQSKEKANGIVEQWVIGKGPLDAPSPKFKNILDNANLSNSIANSAIDIANQVKSIPGIFTSENLNVNFVNGCYTGKSKICRAPTINIFGGGGTGATAIPLLGAINGSTGSIIGVKVTNSGSGYINPPFVEIVDNCNQGYGAVVRSIIDYEETSPTYGQVTDIYIVSEGENYPVEVIENYIVKDIIIQDPGENYSPNDIVIDNFGNQYPTKIFNGSIIKVTPSVPGITGTISTAQQTEINTVNVTDLPILTVKSNTGSGAILRPILDISPIEFQGEINQSIDCVT